MHPHENTYSQSQQFVLADFPPTFTPITEPDHNRRVPYRAGYGSCYKCYCQAFEGIGTWQCENCGHHFNDHWTT